MHAVSRVLVHDAIVRPALGELVDVHSRRTAVVSTEHHRRAPTDRQQLPASRWLRPTHAPTRLISADSRMNRSARPWTTRSIARPRRSEVVASDGIVHTTIGKIGVNRTMSA